MEIAYTPRYTNLYQLLHQSVERFGHKPLFGSRRADGWHWTTYREFGQLVAHAASGLAALGVARGDRVACIANNRLEWAVGAYATYSLGAMYVPMYEAQLDSEWGYILGDCEAKVCLVANSGIKYRVEQQGESLPALQHVICFEDGGYEELLSNGERTPATITPPDDRDIASLIYTSGTTGRPKGVMLTHYNLGADVSACLDIAPLAGEERSLAFLPWAHVFGGVVEINAIMGFGASTAICDDTRKLMDYLPEVQPTVMFAVPRIWNRVYDGVNRQMSTRPAPIRKLFQLGLSARGKRRRGERLSIAESAALPLAERLVFARIKEKMGGRLRFALSGAAALSPEVAEFMANLGVDVYEGYGMTETSGGTTGNTLGACKIGTVGKPLPGVGVHIDREAPGAHGEEGEIVIYGVGVMAGYYGKEDETRAIMTQDGGLRSGDLGYLDADGYLHITGRVKELYKLANGKYVAPAPLEEKIQLSPYISQCVLYGSDHPHNVALIIPQLDALAEWAREQHLPSDPRALVEAPATRALLRAELDRASEGFKGYEKVRDFLIDVEELTPDNDMLTPTLKVKRRNVMAKYEERLKALY